ncbi:MAG: T9SS type A sorting domain-containing protein [Bacteroidales bacterium]|nr:T9SS type A sorting domain-containing protein [Bacteroidales bacterium]
MKSRFIVFLLFIGLININIHAQINYGGTPLSFDQANLKSTPVYYTPYFDYNQLLREDENNKNGAKPYRYGKTHLVNINPENSGVWTNLKSGDKIWRLQIHSDKAYAIGLFFKHFKLNSGVRFFVYSPDKSIVKGAYTSQNNKTDKVFSVLPLTGEDIILELNVPKGVDFGVFELSGIIHDYKNAFGKKLKSAKASGSCNVNVNCPEGANWQNEKRSVVKYTFVSGGYTYMCTGALINNTRKDATPYLLTANHCVSSQTVAQTAVFIFNYESELCNGTIGPTNQTISASDLIAATTAGDLDFTLLKLSTSPPVEYGVYFSGWNRSTTAASNTVTIHHPSGDIKKISMDYDAPVTGNYGSGYITNSHWQILAWDLGTTEGGSSGSPLYDENHHIVGDLTGGEASCYNNVNDYYAKFDMSWDYYSDPNQQLKAWLDPDNTGVLTLDGFDPNLPVDSIDVGVTKIQSPSGAFCLTGLITPKVEVKNSGVKEINSFRIYYALNNSSVYYYDWSGVLPSGNIVSIDLPAVQATAGSGIFKAYTAIPNNAVDENPVNDTLTAQFQADTVIENIKVQGDEYICSEELRGEYFVTEEGNYSWSVNSGTINTGMSSNNIRVQWDKWGDRKVALTISNTCGDYPAEALNVYPVEQGINISINTGNYAVDWNLTKDGKLFTSGNIPENSGNVLIPLCIMSGCYTLNISGGSNCTDCSYSVVDANNEVLVSGNYSGVPQTASFCVDDKSEAIYNVYPNPAKNQLTIEANFIEAYENATFAIYTLNGAIRVPENPLNGAMQIDISELKNGYYLLKIRSDYGEYTKNFVKQ